MNEKNDEPKRTELGPKLEISKHIFNTIFNAISSSEHIHSNKINITDLSKIIGVKSKLVIDALNILCNYGIIEKKLNKNEFYQVTAYYNDIMQAHIMHSMLGSKASFLCAVMNPCPNIKRIEELADEFNKIDYSNNIVSVDFEFHNLIIHSCGNKYIIKFYESMSKQIEQYKFLNLEYLMKYKIDEDFTYQHNKIFNAIALNEPKLAQVEMQKHITQGFIDTIFFSQLDS